MTLRSPAAAMLWENWRLTRVEAAQRFVQGLLLAGGVLVASSALGRSGNDSARSALFLLGLTYMPLWLSVAKLNGGRFMDGYRPGYPFRFFYTRPVGTLALVAAPMAYNVASVAALYIVSALVMRAAFGYPFPVLPVAALIAAFHAVQWAAQWGTSNKVLQWIGATVGGLGFTALAVWRGEEWPARFGLSGAEYALLAAVVMTSFGVTVAGVARQRRGDAQVASPRTTTRSGFSDWLAGLVRIPCPTTSAARAQVWLELRSSGLPVLAIGLALAIVIPLLFVVTTQLDLLLSRHFARPATRGIAPLLAISFLPVVLLLSGNAFGIRSRQGRKYASPFEATQAFGTAWMAGLKVLVRAVCLLVALLLVGTSIWTSASVIPFDVLEDNDTFIEKSRSPISAAMRAIEGTIRAMGADQQLALAFVLVTAVAAMIAWRAAHAALRARYARGMNIAVSLVLIVGVALVLVVFLGQRWSGVNTLGDVVFGTTAWVIAAAIVLATVYLFWRVVAEGVITPPQAGGIVVVAAAVGAAWVTTLRAAGVPLADMPATDGFWLLSPALLPLTAGVLALWSYSRVRHT